VNRIGVRPLAATGTAIAAAGMWWLSHLHLHAGYLTGVMLPLMVLSVGLGLTFVPLTLTAVSGVKEEHSGLVSGVSTTAIQIGGSIGVAVLATVAATTASHHAGAAGAAALAAGYTQAFRAGAVIIALAVPLALVFLRLRPGGQPAVPRRRLLTRWCPVSATVPERRDAPAAGWSPAMPVLKVGADGLQSAARTSRGRGTAALRGGGGRGGRGQPALLGSAGRRPAPRRQDV
jgi:hypothetical protein